MSKLLIYNALCDIWSRLLVPSDYDRKNKEYCQLDLSHIGIHWKTVVDQETLDDPVSNCLVPYTDFTSFIMKYILKH
jgi:hypothetical protein